MWVMSFAAWTQLLAPALLVAQQDPESVLLSLQSASSCPLFWDYHSLVEGLLSCFCCALGGLCCVIAPTVALCPPVWWHL